MSDQISPEVNSGWNNARVAKIMSGFEAEKATRPWSSQPVDLAIETYVAKMQLAHDTNRVVDPETNDRALAFWHTIGQVVKEIGPTSPVDIRILRSELVVLYALVADGEIEELYKQDLKRKKLSDAGWGEDQKLDYKADLAVSVLQGVRKHSREENLAAEFDRPPEIGYEVEFDDGLWSMVGVMDMTNMQIERMETLLALEGKISPIEKTELDKLLINWREIRSAWEGATLILGDLAYYPKDELKKKFQHFATVMDSLHRSGVADQSKDSIALGEIRSRPALSVKLPIRELAQAIITQEVVGLLGLHETMTGSVLTKEYVEPMLVLPMLNSVQLTSFSFELSQLDKAIYENAGELLSDGKALTLGDPFAKLSRIGQEYLLFPYYKIREPQELEQYVGNHSTGWELRSALAFTKEQLPQLVRQMRFVANAGWGISAYQKLSRTRNTKEQALASAWQEYVSNWSALLEERGIPMLEKKKFHYVVDEAHAEKLVNEYIQTNGAVSGETRDDLMDSARSVSAKDALQKDPYSYA